MVQGNFSSYTQVSVASSFVSVTSEDDDASCASALAIPRVSEGTGDASCASTLFYVRTCSSIPVVRGEWRITAANLRLRGAVWQSAG